MPDRERGGRGPARATVQRTRERTPRGDDRTPRIRIIHETDDIIAIAKPLGLPTALMPGERGLSAAVALGELRRGAARPLRPWVLHRLDREATGVVVFAKSKVAFERLNDAFRGRGVLRQYIALVEGEVSLAASDTAVQAESDSAASDNVPEETRLEDEDRVLRQGAFGTINTVLVETREGVVKSMSADAYRVPASKSKKSPPRKAVMHYEVLAKGRGLSLLRVMTRSGHKHQVRAQLAGIGHPIAGDRMYGATSDPLRRVGLHATEIAWPEALGRGRATCPAPAAFYRAVGAAPPTAEREDAAQRQPSAQDGGSTEGWEHVAAWYDAHLTRGPSDLYREVVLPGVLRMLDVKAGQRVLDVACGQGWLARELITASADVVGVDASPSLITAAKSHAESARFLVGDARELERVLHEAGLDGGSALETFDAAVCVLALMNIEPLHPVLAGVSRALRGGGRFVAVILHPAFRSPGRTSWGWEESSLSHTSGSEVLGAGYSTSPRRGTPDVTTRRPPPLVQYRRVDAYLSPGRSDIVMNPGAAAHGAEPVHTWTYHRPIGAYVEALAKAGLLIEAMEEWPSHRRSEPGPRAAVEDRARREIPMFLAIRAIKRD